MAVVDWALWPTACAVPDADRLDGRARLEARLGIDVRVLRQPITALSLLAPLGTALVTTLLPVG